ncbi:hypothetical protein ATANTOWER_025523 [Ataeniobius toweri]|uniref:Uncharacterized protein n=1 Tax=Ataeniobius toweri TaxID=208326 RepID=A0ABU7A817_9TELE|nr:hypothetical protein [Ataeniobius toweri]
MPAACSQAHPVCCIIFISYIFPSNIQISVLQMLFVGEDAGFEDTPADDQVIRSLEMFEFPCWFLTTLEGSMFLSLHNLEHGNPLQFFIAFKRLPACSLKFSTQYSFGSQTPNIWKQTTSKPALHLPPGTSSPF